MVSEFPDKLTTVRGRGFLVGVQVVGDPGAWVSKLREHGLLVPSAGTNVVRMLPPLNATAEELGRAVEIWREALGGARCP